ncbi:MAG: tetratricopeptide repeat protein [Thermoplasmata archaeon]
MKREILGSIDDFIGEEIYSSLGNSEKQMMKVASLFDRPFEANALFIDEGLDFDTLLTLRNKSLIRMVADGRYEAHEVIRLYFRRILTPSEKERYSREILPYLLEQGRRARRSYRNDDAIGYFSNALELEVGDGGRLKALEELGGIHELIGQYDQALDRYQRVLSLSPDVEISAKIQRKMGRVHLLTGDAKTALKVLQKAREIVEDDDSLEAGKLRLAHAQVLHRMRRWEESRKMAHEALDILKRRQDQEDELGKVHSILGLSHIFGEPQDLEEAEKHLLASLDLRKRAGSLEGEGATQNNLGILYVHLGDGEKALEHLRDGVKLAEETGSFYTAAKVTLTTGCAHYELLGEFDEGEKQIGKAIQIAQDAGDEYIQCIGHRNLSRVHRYKGDLERALEHSLKYLDLAEKTGMVWDQMNAHLERAKEFLALGRLSDATTSCGMAHRMASDLDETLQTADCLRVQGAIHRSEGNWKESQAALSRAIELLEEAKDEFGLAMAYYDYALFYRDTGIPEKARQFADRAVKLFESLRVHWLAKRVKDDIGRLKGAPT